MASEETAREARAQAGRNVFIDFEDDAAADGDGALVLSDPGVEIAGCPRG
jgi:hypothetical protein